MEFKSWILFAFILILGILLSVAIYPSQDEVIRRLQGASEKQISDFNNPPQFQHF